MTRKIVILGSTGSIGRQVLQVVDEFPGHYQVVALAAGSNVSLLAEQIKKYQPEVVSVATAEVAERLKSLLGKTGINLEIVTGINGMVNLARLNGIDLIVIGVTGIHGLRPTLAALEKGTTVALANKETLVTAGALVMAKAREKAIKIIPVDSEHSAILQCLEERNRGVVAKLLLTASGGPFLWKTRAEMEKVTPEMALRHPRWQMGVKITIDSASLINKGLEVIEAHWLFDIPYERIEVVVHPQSIIHSMVQYADGSVLAQLGLPDMRVPIQFALTYPARRENSFPKLDFYRMQELTFMKPDLEKFPGLRLAYEAGKTGGTMPTVYNAANEAAVELFLNGRIKFTSIPVLIAGVMDCHNPRSNFSVEDILEIDEWARSKAKLIAAQS